MYASHFNWLQVSFRRTSLSSTGFESRKGERFPRAQGRRYLPVSASILLYFESLILNPTLRCERSEPRRGTAHLWPFIPSRRATQVGLGRLAQSYCRSRVNPRSVAGTSG